MAGRTSSSKRYPTPVDYDLTCRYLNQRRGLELVGGETVSPRMKRAGSFGSDGDHFRRIAELSTIKDALVAWLGTTNPPTLGQLLITNTLATNSFFTIFTNFYCRGFPNIHEALNKGKTPAPLAEAYAKFDDLREGLTCPH